MKSGIGRVLFLSSFTHEVDFLSFQKGVSGANNLNLDRHVMLLAAVFMILLVS